MWSSSVQLFILIASTTFFNGAEAQRLCRRNEQCLRKSECRPLANKKFSDLSQIKTCGRDIISSDSSFKVCCWDECWNDKVPGADFLSSYEKRRAYCANQSNADTRFVMKSGRKSSNRRTNSAHKKKYQCNRSGNMIQPWSHDQLSSECKKNEGLLGNQIELIKMLPKECGVARAVNLKIYLVKRVTHGEEVQVMAQPWMAMLKYQRYKYVSDRNHSKVYSSSAYYCGGTLISSKFVLTAAHCIAPDKTDCYTDDKLCSELIGVSLGERDVMKRGDKDCVRVANSEMCSVQPENYNIKCIYVHENYNSGTILLNDIALIRLEGEVTLATTKTSVSPVCLPIKKLACEDHRKKNLTVAGWGRYTKKGKKVHVNASEVLRSASFKLVNRTSCRDAYKGSELFEKVSKFTLCAKGEGSQDACHGDSGGPLLVKSNDGRMVLIGVVSFGSPDCNSTLLPGVYTKVASYMEWILNTMYHDLKN